MATFVCPDDPTHQSTSHDVCSVCGALMEDVPAAPGPVAAASTRSGPAPTTGGLPAAFGNVCTHCGVPRTPGEAFCENCGLDFATGSLEVADAPPPAATPVASVAAPAGAPATASGGFPTVAMAAVTAATAPAVAPPADGSAAPTSSPTSSGTLQATLQAVVTIDEGTRERPDDVVVPDDKSTRIYLLDADRLLIGRGSSTVHPNIVLRGDTGVSRGHAELMRQRDGSYAVRDLGSANGTSVNGQALAEQELKPVAAGDTISIGFWHLITLREC